MKGRFSFALQSEAGNFPDKVTLTQRDTETSAHVVLKFLGFMIFFRERLQLEPNLHNDNIPFRPDLVQLDLQLRPVLWVECGECGVQKLDKLSVKAPDAELWIIKSSEAAAQDLMQRMAKADLRTNRYKIIALDDEVITEISSLLRPRNEVLWVASSFEPPECQFDLNGLWFDLSFAIHRF